MDSTRQTLQGTEDVETQIVTYGGFWKSSPRRRFEKDAPLRARDGWRVVDTMVQPRFLLNMPRKITVTYERRRAADSQRS